MPVVRTKTSLLAAVASVIPWYLRIGAQSERKFVLLGDRSQCSSQKLLSSFAILFWAYSANSWPSCVKISGGRCLQADTAASWCTVLPLQLHTALALNIGLRAGFVGAPRENFQGWQLLANIWRCPLLRASAIFAFIFPGKHSMLWSCVLQAALD